MPNGNLLVYSRYISIKDRKNVTSKRAIVEVQSIYLAAGDGDRQVVDGQVI